MEEEEVGREGRKVCGENFHNTQDGSKSLEAKIVSMRFLEFL